TATSSCNSPTGPAGEASSTSSTSWRPFPVYAECRRALAEAVLALRSERGRFGNLFNHIDDGIIRSVPDDILVRKSAAAYEPMSVGCRIANLLITQHQIPTRRAMRRKGTIRILLVVILLFSAGCAGCNTYTTMVQAEEIVEQAWADVETQYQRRADLIPN